MSERLLLLWGKTSGDGGSSAYHPALFHMIDVGNVANVMSGVSVSPRWRTVIAQAFGDQPDHVIRWLPWLVSLHDIGKISSSFQAQDAAQTARLEGYEFQLRPFIDLHHTVIGSSFTKSHLKESLPPALNTVLRDMIGGHHGLFLSPGEIRDAGKRMERDENAEWGLLRQEAVQILQNLFLEPTISMPIPPNLSTAVMALSGFTVLCDWIGSNSLYFPVTPGLSIDEYQPLSKERARKAVLESGFCQDWLSPVPPTVASIFSNLPSLRPLQQEIDHIPDSVLAQPCLTVIEAPTGEGKTEAALALAHRIGALRGSDEIYYALPTTATSNQMYHRLTTYFTERLSLSAHVKIVHGQAFLLEDEIACLPLGNGKNDPSSMASIEWFSSKKRALLAPFGVGTIDQAELGALNVRHNMLRLMGLAGKVLVLDEVHAYDTYMTTIIERLLAWLAVLGTSVIILSATLPHSRRVRLAQAYGTPLPEGPSHLEHYPCVFIGNKTENYTASPAASQPRRIVDLVQMHLSESNPEHLARWLLEQLSEEGCACWITNTVARAQQLYAKLDELAPPEVQRTLIHSRFPVADRQRIENELAVLYGPTGQRPAHGIVIGTQVLEQSLDLDFDLMVSDLAPIDLLLQRAGRLHRHLRPRPKAHLVPCLWVNSQPGASGQPSFGTDRRIYHEYLLLRTWHAIQQRNHFELPADYRSLIKEVYDAGEPNPTQADLYTVWKDLQRHERDERGEANLRLLPLPSSATSFTASSNLVFEENEDKASWIIAKTRLGEEGVTVVPVEKISLACACYGLETFFPLNHALDKPSQLAFLRRSIKLSGKDLVETIQSQERPPVFSQSGLLKNVYPLWMTGRRAELTNSQARFEFVLDPRLGLVIKRQKG